MPSPSDSSAAQQIVAPGPRRRKKACQRCRSRKQRCDYETPPCHNCATAGVECLPVVQEVYEQHPVGYVRSLEQHAAALEKCLNEQFPGSAPDHLHNVQAGYMGMVQPPPHHSSRSPESPGQFQWQLAQATALADASFHDEMTGVTGWQDADALVDLTGLTQSSPRDAAGNPTGVGGATQHISPSLNTVTAVPAHPPPQYAVVAQTQPVQPERIPPATAASFFRTYFSYIHTQYPFLNIRDCGEWYLQWKNAPLEAPIAGWPAFFVKMIFAVGSLIESKSDTAPRYQHQDLKSQAQAEQAIVMDSKSSSLIRMQAMLLSAMLALHSDSTSRIAHISGVIIRFGALQGFHLLVNDGEEETLAKIKAWSCAYILDRAVAGTLDVPVSLADTYISTPLYSDSVFPPEPPVDHTSMPWLSDLPPTDPPPIYPSTSTFAHVCRIRVLQSYILNELHTVNRPTLQSVSVSFSDPSPSSFSPFGNGLTSHHHHQQHQQHQHQHLMSQFQSPFNPQPQVPIPHTEEWHAHLRAEIDTWSRTDQIYTHSLPNTESYQSPLWLSLISQISRLILSRPSPLNIHSLTSDIALHAACDACTIFRLLQKRRQIAQPWLVVLTQFQAGITLFYIALNRGAVPLEKEVDNAGRDCAAVLAIFADRWRNAEHYCECVEVLGRSVPRARPVSWPSHSLSSSLPINIPGVDNTNGNGTTGVGGVGGGLGGGLGGGGNGQQQTHTRWVLEKSAREELRALTERVHEVGVHKDVGRMLWEMCEGPPGEEDSGSVGGGSGGGDGAMQVG